MTLDINDPIIFGINDNLRAVAWVARDQPDAVMIHFQARCTEEKVGFKVTCAEPIQDPIWQMPSLKGGQWLTKKEINEPFCYAISLNRAFLDQPFILGLRFPSTRDPRTCILEASAWDGSGGASSLVYMEFP